MADYIGRSWLGGYLNMGPQQIPPLPMIVVLTDRADGKLWQLTHRVSDERFLLSDAPVPVSLRGQVRQYGAFDGPVLGDGPGIRLLVRAGRIGYEMVQSQQGVTDMDNAPVMTRRGTQNFSLLLTLAGWLRDGDRIGYRLELS